MARTPAATSARWLAVAALVVLDGCATLNSAPSPRPAIAADMPLSGRIAVKVDGPSPRAVSAVFDLQGNALTGSLGLSTPLGSMLAQARWSPAGVTLTTPKGRSAYADLDSLTRDVLGEPVPVAAMFDWLRARPWPDARSSAVAAPGKGFEQLGWSVDLGRFDSGFVDAQRSAAPPVTVRVHLD